MYFILFFSKKVQRSYEKDNGPFLIFPPVKGKGKREKQLKHAIID